jgi:hypothetical protein
MSHRLVADRKDHADECTQRRGAVDSLDLLVLNLLVVRTRSRHQTRAQGGPGQYRQSIRSEWCAEYSANTAGPISRCESACVDRRTAGGGSGRRPPSPTGTRFEGAERARDCCATTRGTGATRGRGDGRLFGGFRPGRHARSDGDAVAGPGDDIGRSGTRGGTRDGAATRAALCDGSHPLHSR